MLLASAAQCFKTRNARHAHVGNHHVDGARAEDLQRFLAGIDGDRFEVLRLQERIEQAALRGVVIDDEEGWTLGGSHGRIFRVERV